MKRFFFLPLSSSRLFGPSFFLPSLYLRKYANQIIYFTYWIEFIFRRTRCVSIKTFSSLFFLLNDINSVLVKSVRQENDLFFYLKRKENNKKIESLFMSSCMFFCLINYSFKCKIYIFCVFIISVCLFAKTHEKKSLIRKWDRWKKWSVFVWFSWDTPKWTYDMKPHIMEMKTFFMLNV